VARFLAEVEGNRKDSHRLGTPASGIRAEARGWDVGVKVYGRADGDADVFDIWSSGGSNGGTHELIGHVRLVDGTPTFYPPAA
jgi:hypothetical protein